MIFSFFSRKQPTHTEDELQAHSDKPGNNIDDNNDIDRDRDTSSAILPPPSKSPSPSPFSLPLPPPPQETTDQATDSLSLHSLIRSVPPQIFHAYSLDRLGSNTPPAILTALSSFFSALVPPPRLHCVRCHKSYFEVENTDRSCLVPHDDESAEVERVPLSTSKAKGLASEYETHWGCCERTVEGDGDMGPPDGWCYEGKHTTDIKRARFRADSTPNDDKLVPCSRLRCPGQLLSPSPSSAHSHTRRPARKRTRPIEDETEAEDPMSQTDVENTTASPKRRRTKSATSRRKSGGSNSAAATASDAKLPKEEEKEDKEEKKSNVMDVDHPSAPNPSSPPRPKPRSIRKPKSAATIDGNESSTSARTKPRSKSRARKPKSSIAAAISTPSNPRQSSPAVQQNHEPSSLFKPKVSDPVLPQGVVDRAIPHQTKAISILEHQFNNSVGSLSELSSIKSSSPGCGAKIVQRVAYVELTKAKRPLLSEETMIVDTDKETDDNKADNEKDKDEDNEDRTEPPKALKAMMKAKSGTRPLSKRKVDIIDAIKSARGRTRTKLLSEVVDTSVDAEKMQE